MSEEAPSSTHTAANVAAQPAGYLFKPRHLDASSWDGVTDATLFLMNSGGVSAKAISDAIRNRNPDLRIHVTMDHKRHIATLQSNPSTIYKLADRE
jgi:hypothetical protein